MLFAYLKLQDPEAKGAVIDFDRQIVKSSRTISAALKAGVSNIEELVAGTLKQDWYLGGGVIFYKGAVVIIDPYEGMWIELNLCK